MRKVKASLQSEHGKELGIDLLALSNAMSVTAVYCFSLLNFVDERGLGSVSKYFSYIILCIFFLNNFTTTSETNENLFQQSFDSRWTSIKRTTRRVTGIPTALTKSVVGALSFFEVSKEYAPLSFSVFLAIFGGLCGLPSQLSLSWSKLVQGHHEPSDVVANETSPILAASTQTNMSDLRRYLLMLFIHVTTFFYSLNSTSIYFGNTINLPKDLEVMDAPIASTEEIPFSIIAVSMFMVLLSTHFSYAHLSENMFGLTASESKRYGQFKAVIKYGTALPNIIATAASGSGALFEELRKIGWDKPVSYAMSAATLPGSLVYLSSVFAANPVKVGRSGSSSAVEDDDRSSSSSSSEQSSYESSSTLE